MHKSTTLYMWCLDIAACLCTQHAATTQHNQHVEQCDLVLDFGAGLCFADRPWYTNVRIMAVPVVLAYIIICIVYIIIRAAKSISRISAPAYGIVVLIMEALGMVSLLQAGINHLYKVCDSRRRMQPCVMYQAEDNLDRVCPRAFD